MPRQSPVRTRASYIVTLALTDEIRNDHERILSRLRQLSARPGITANSVRPIMAAIGAHHLAEEDTLYDALKTFALAGVGEAKVYHLVLDDLTHTIECDQLNAEPLRYQLRLLEHLLEHHFKVEETQLLEILVGKFSLQQQLGLGREYRERYRNNISALQRAGPRFHLAPVVVEDP